MKDGLCKGGVEVYWEGGSGLKDGIRALGENLYWVNWGCWWRSVTVGDIGRRGITHT